MTIIHADRVQETSNTTGLGNFLLNGAQPGYYSFFGSFGTTDTCAYTIWNPVTGENEVGTGQIIDNGNGTYSLQRQAVERSSNANGLVNFTTGKKLVCAPLLASELATFAGDVTGPNPGIANAGAVIADTTGKVLRNSTVLFHPVATVSEGTVDKPEFGATFEDWMVATDAANVVFDFNAANRWIVTLGGNRNLTYVNAMVGQEVTLLVYQDVVGNRTPNWWSNIAWDRALAPIIDPMAGGWNLVKLVCDSAGSGSGAVPTWKEVSRRCSALRDQIVNFADAATITFDPRISLDMTATLGGNRTLALQTSQLYVGQKFMVSLIQDPTGTRIPTWWANIDWAGGAPTLSTAPNEMDQFGFRVTAIGASPSFTAYVLGQGM